MFAVGKLTSLREPHRIFSHIHDFARSEPRPATQARCWLLGGWYRNRIHSVRVLDPFDDALALPKRCPFPLTPQARDEPILFLSPPVETHDHRLHHR